MTYDGDWRETFRPDIPSVARIYDYLLGGKDNYPADRAVGESMIAQLPNVRLAVQWNRAFLRRVVRYLIREAHGAERSGGLFVHHCALWYHGTQGHHRVDPPGPTRTATM